MIRMDLLLCNLFVAASALGAEATPPGGPEAPADWMTAAKPYVLVAGIIILLFSLMRMRRRQAAGKSGRAEASAASSRSVYRADVERLAVDFEETARSVSALLDTKIRVLDKLIADADARIARLEALGGGSAAGPGDAAGRPGPDGPAAEPEPPAAPEEPLGHHAHIYSLADQGLSVQEIAEKSGHPVGEVELVLSLRKIKRPRN